MFSANATSGTNIAATGSLTLTGGTNVYFNSGTTDLLRPAATLAAARTADATVTGTTTVTNTGSLPQTLTLKQKQVGGSGLAPGTGLVGTDPALFKKLQICVSVAPANDCSVYNSAFDVAPASTDGTGDSVLSNAIDTLTFAPAASRSYNFEVWMQDDADTDNDYQSQIATAIFQFDAN